MSTPDHARPRIPARGSPEARRPEARRPAGWGRLGLAAILGVVAGTVLFSTPAKGRARP